MIIINKKCELCGKEIIAHSKNKRFCTRCVMNKYNIIKGKYYSNPINRKRLNKQSRESYQRHKKETYIRHKIYTIKNPLKVRAHWAVAKGKIKTLSYCEICKTTNGRMEKHHWSYSKPLLVNTLCKSCHAIQHVKHFKSSKFGRIIK